MSTKHNIRVGCWNVRSLGNPTWQNTRLRAVIISEVRWPGHGVSQIGKSVIAYSGLAEEEPQPHRRCVAMVMSESAASAWRFAGSLVDPVSKRILRLRLKSHTGFLSLIAVYALTNEPMNEQESVAFYQFLHECVRQVPRSEMLLVLGDFNARVGNDAAT